MAKLALLPLTADLFLEFARICKDGPPRCLRVTKNPLPDDAKIISVEVPWDRPPFTLALLLTSESFANVPEGQSLPELPDVWFETIYDECTGAIA